jgi:hypothetical protein
MTLAAEAAAAMEDRKDYVSLLTQWSAKKMARLEMRKVDPTHCIVLVNEKVKADVNRAGMGLNWKKIKQLCVYVSLLSCLCELTGK